MLVANQVGLSLITASFGSWLCHILFCFLSMGNSMLHNLSYCRSSRLLKPLNSRPKTDWKRETSRGQSLPGLARLSQLPAEQNESLQGFVVRKRNWNLLLWTPQISMMVWAVLLRKCLYLHKSPLHQHLLVYRMGAQNWIQGNSVCDWGFFCFF